MDSQGKMLYDAKYYLIARTYEQVRIMLSRCPTLPPPDSSINVVV